jgi:mannonate dehydratase
MILTDYLLCQPSIQWQYARQLGIEHAVIRLPEDDRFDFADRSHWQAIYQRFGAAGLKPLVIEPLPNALHDAIKAGDSRRDACIERVIAMLPIMAELDIRVICCNFMAHVGWYRTARDLPDRGDARVTGFDLADVPPDLGTDISEARLWDNLAYFLQAVLPHAERHGIKLALHPDDPPVPRLGRVSRILTSLANIRRALHLVESDYLGVTFCQATYSAMGEDLEQAVRELAGAGKIFFIHFRDIVGNRNQFRESFHDNGQTDMARMVRLYQDLGCQAPVRVDHVPTMAGESNQTPGYATVGRLYAIGYLKGLIDGVAVRD